MCQDRR